MRYRSFLTAAFLISGLSLFHFPSFAQPKVSSNYKVLSSEKTGLSINAVLSYLSLADKSINEGDFENAIELLKKARTVSKLLISYYRDINGSFRGLDALIPREMNKKNRQIVSLLAKSNLRLATIHRKENESELAVPLFVEVLRIKSPSSAEGLEAYKGLIELGFVETPYAGQRKALEQKL